MFKYKILLKYYMGKKEIPLNSDNYFAQQVYRVLVNGKGYIGALVRRRYDEFDVEKKGIGKYIGIEEVEIHDMVTDNDPESETFGKRIEDPNDEGGRKKMQFVETDDAKALEKFRKLTGTTNYGTTILTYKFREQTFEAPDNEEFWTANIQDIHRKYIQKLTVAPEQSMSRPRVTK